MSYIPTEWKTGDIVTAEKLNKLEEGVAASGGGGGGGLIVKCTGIATYEVDDRDEYWTIPLDKTIEEIASALPNGPVFISVPLLGIESPYYTYEGACTLFQIWQVYNTNINLITPADGLITLGSVDVTDIYCSEIDSTTVIQITRSNPF